MDGTQRIMVDKLIETSMYTNLTKNDVKNDTNKDKMDNTAYVKEIMEDYSSYKEFVKIDFHSQNSKVCFGFFLKIYGFYGFISL